MTHKYWAENRAKGKLPVSDGELEVVCSGDFVKALRDGKACQFYEFDYTTAIERYTKEYPEADLWYTERNGDSITMLCPKGTDSRRLPSVAMDYIVYEWIKHDQDFGSGVIPLSSAPPAPTPTGRDT